MINHRKHARRGSTYIIVVSTAMIVSVLGLSTLMVQRIQRQAFQHTTDVEQARLCAQGAVRMGMLRIENDPDWRYSFANGIWEADVPITGGTYTLEGIDPSDGDLADAPQDPLVLIGTGRQGNAVQKMQISLAPENRGLSCLEVALQAGGLIDMDYAVAWSNQTFSSNAGIDAYNSYVLCDVEAVNSISGWWYYEGIDAGVDPRELPDPNSVFDYYKNNGTWIDITDLPSGFANVLKNPGIEDGTTGWNPSTGTGFGVACDIAQDTTVAAGGNASLKVTNRQAWNAGPIQYLTDVIQNGTSYDVTVWVRLGAGMADARMVINTNGSDSGSRWFIGSQRQVDTEWTPLTATLTPTWSGTLISSFLKIETVFGLGQPDFSIDDVVVKESGTMRTIYQQVLSPAHNPFGNETNGEGIYVIDCQGSEICVKNSRIVGTLVLLNPDDDSLIGGGPLSWEPAVSNYPALMVDNAEITIAVTDNGLGEYANNTNFNPPGAPHDSSGEDADQDDTYASQMTGLIYSSDKLHFANHPVIYGAVMGNSNVYIEATLELIHNPVYLDNPPPGFSGPEEIKIVLESAAKVVD